MKSGFIFLSTLLLASIFVIINSGTASAETTEEIVGAAESAELSSGSGEVSTASGSNRFAAWADETPGNFDIFFKRSTDNGASWKATVNLSNNAGGSSRPQIAVSGVNVYVSWLQENAGGDSSDAFIRRSTDNGVTWGAKVNLSKSGVVSLDRDIAISGSNVYVAWVENDGSTLFRRSTDNGVIWGPIKELGDNSLISNSIDLIASGSKVYIVWADANLDILFRKSTNNGATWSSAKNISNNTADSHSPRIVISGVNLYVVWNDEKTGAFDVFFRRSTDDGATWKAVKNLSTSDNGALIQDIAFSGSNVFVVWRQQEDIAADDFDFYFRRSVDSGATWGTIVPISTSNQNFESTARISATGSNVFVVWGEALGGDIYLKRSTDSGATFKAVVNLSKTGGAGGPQIAVSGSSVYLAWADGTSGNGDILFKRSTDNGAGWKPTINLSNNVGFSFAPQLGV